MSRYRPLNVTDTMPFGKYIGKALFEIGIEDVSYLHWLCEKAGVELSFDPHNVDYFSYLGSNVEYDEKLLNEYLDQHPNPFNLERWELKLAVLSSINRVKKTGNPTVDDWDDEVYQKPEYKSVRYGNTY